MFDTCALQVFIRVLTARDVRGTMVVEAKEFLHECTRRAFNRAAYHLCPLVFLLHGSANVLLSHSNVQRPEQSMRTSHL